MQHIIKMLSNTSEAFQILLFTGTLFICWNIEVVAGLTLNYKRWQHAYLNAKFIFTNIPIQFLLGLAFTFTMNWTLGHHFGFLQYLPFSGNRIVLFLETFIFLDFGEYIYHILMHRIKRFWMFHVVHHCDSVVDASTTLREHPGENFIRNSFTLLWVFLSGAYFWALILRQAIQIISNLFSHINCRLPERADRIIGMVFITPNLHHVHHHHKQPFTDCNYGDVLSVWDRIFGTFARLPASKLLFGIDTYMNEAETSNYRSLVKIPFQKYRKRVVV